MDVPIRHHVERLSRARVHVLKNELKVWSEWERGNCEDGKEAQGPWPVRLEKNQEKWNWDEGISACGEVGAVESA